MSEQDIYTSAFRQAYDDALAHNETPMEAMDEAREHAANALFFARNEEVFV